MTDTGIEHLITAERDRLGVVLADLTDDEWATPSLCDGWTVRDVTGHLVVAFAADVRRVGAAVVRAFGNFDRAMDREARAEAALPTADLLDRYRRLAPEVHPPPLLGPRAPLTDILVHSQDIALPIGRRIEPDLDAVRIALDFRATHRLGAKFGGRVPADTTLVATDVDWRHVSGSGSSRLEASAVQLLLLVTGRLERSALEPTG